VVYFYQRHVAGLFAMLLSVVPIAYNLSLLPLIRQKRSHSWLRYLSVTIDVMGLTLYNTVDTVFTSAFVPATSATLILYPVILFLASLRLDRTLIIYGTALSVVTMNALFAFAYPRFDPEIVSRIVSADIPGQVYRTVYVVLCGILMLFVPGTIARLLKNQQDIYEDSKINYELARRDNLTGLANRRVLEQHLSQEIAYAGRDETKLALLYLDLDGFKPVNDTWGHDVGDLVLKETATRLLASVREHDLVVRVGGDEFVVVLFRIDSDLVCRQLVERITENIELPYYIGEGKIMIGVSVGIAIFPDDALTSGELIEKADRAMLVGKKGKR